MSIEMLRWTVFLDIETVRNRNLNAALRQKLIEKIEPDGRLTDPAKIALDIQKKTATLEEGFSLNPLTMQIVCIGLAVNEDVPNLFFHDSDEKSILKSTASYLADVSPERIVTFYGNSFDIPALRFRMAFHKIAIPECLQMVNRYNLSLFDIHEILTSYGAIKKIGTLSEVALALNIPVNLEMDGSEVEAYFNNGQLFEISEKCKGDILIMQDIYRYVVGYIR